MQTQNANVEEVRNTRALGNYILWFYVSLRRLHIVPSEREYQLEHQTISENVKGLVDNTAQCEYCTLYFAFVAIWLSKQQMRGCCKCP